MRHILVMNSKGGSGKSTISTNLASYYAAQGKSVLLMDYDPQESALDWLAQRSAARPPIKGQSGWEGTGRAGQDVDVAVIDSPAGALGREISELLRYADSILIPVLPSPIDMRAAKKFIDKVKDNNKVVNGQAKIALIANRVRENTNVYQELDGFLTEFDVPVLTHLRDSMNYVKSAERGIGVFEMAPYASRVEREQWAPIIDWLDSDASQPDKSSSTGGFRDGRHRRL